jgi:hypothetical protein
MEPFQLLKDGVFRQVVEYGVCHFNDPDKQSILSDDDWLNRYAHSKWKAEKPFACDYDIVATLGTPMSGKSKCMLTRLPRKLANEDQPHFSMIYLAPTLLVVMLMAT